MVYFCLLIAGSDRSHWHHSDENMAVRRDWATELLSSFKRDVGRVREAFTTSPNLSPDHQLHEAQRASVQAVVSKPRGSLAQGTASIKPARGGSATKLLESCVVMRLEDFTLYRVSTASDSKRSTPKKLLASDKKQLLLPPEMSSVHMEYTDYYFPEGIDYPGRSSALCLHHDLIGYVRHPGGNYWNYKPGALSFGQVNATHFEDQVPVDFIDGYLILKMSCTDLTSMRGYQDFSASNGHQGSCPILMA